jgi:hypothetical protein
LKRSFKIWIALIAVVFSCFRVSGQIAKKQVEALKITDHITIDGLLDETVWQNAMPAKDFFQFDPYNGPPATEKTEVRICYDNIAIYIGAMMYDSAPDSILTELGFRDTDDLNNDYINIILSPFNDGLNAFMLGVTASGVQYDAKIYNDNSDKGWDAVYQTRVQILDNGWSAEMMIPYSVLRFPEKDIQTWGFNVERSIRRKREIDTWSFVDKKIEGELRQAGTLSNLKDIRPPLRLSFTPYVSGYMEKNAADPDWGYSFNYGMDVKYGINESFTLDMTLIPDFGQVQSDDEIFNLSPFEVYYEEKRPFFTEGTELFSKGDVFYSRRIGDTPDGFNSVSDSLRTNELISENPSKTKLINATKVSGRTNKGLGIGVFNAMSGHTFATITDTLTGKTREIETQAFTNYNMVVLDQSLKNNSYVSFYNTNVYKGKDHVTSNVTGTEFQFSNKESTYAIDGRFNLSQKYHAGDAPGLGYAYNVSLMKTSGRFRFNFSRYVEDDKYDPNELGYLDVNNEITHGLSLNYNFYDPFWRLLWWYNSFSVWYQQQYAPREYVEFGFWGNSRATFRNRLTVGADFEVLPVDQNDFFEARTAGRKFVKPASWEIGGFLSPDYRKAFIVDVRASMERAAGYNQSEWQASLSPRWRVNDKLSFRLSSSYEMDMNDIGYVDERFVLNQQEIIFGRRDLQTIENVLSTTYIFNNLLALDFRLRHYWLTARYDRFYLLDDAGTLSHTDYGQNNDFNFNAFNIDMILRWEFAPGSELAVAWKNAVLTYNQSDITDTYFRNLKNIIESPSDNSFSVKLLYYLDYVYLKKRQ